MSMNKVVGNSADVTANADDTRTLRSERPKVRPPRPAARKPGPDLAVFEHWLSELGMLAKPSIHVNGPQFASCLMAVDFGMPLKQPRLTPDQSAELSARLRKAAGDLVMSDPRMCKIVEASGRDVSIRIYSDNSAGVWWASVG